MTLYAIPFTCSLAVRLTLAELGSPHEVRWMKRFEHALDDGRSFDDLNPKRRVPALALPDGELLTEIVAVQTFLDAAVVRTPSERRRELEWCCYLATELHRPILFALFDPATPPATVEDMLTRHLPPVLDHLERHLSHRPTLLGGEAPSPADHYLMWALWLLRFRKIGRPTLDAFIARLSLRESVRAVLAEERAQLARLA